MGRPLPATSAAQNLFMPKWPPSGPVLFSPFRILSLCPPSLLLGQNQTHLSQSYGQYSEFFITPV